MFGHIGSLLRIASLWPKAFNKAGKWPLIKNIQKWAGITPFRELPPTANQRFSSWIKQREMKHADKSVVLFNDTFTEFNQPEIGIAAVAVLEKLGYQVIIPSWSCCGRPAMSKGMLYEAKEMAYIIVQKLIPFANQGLPIIGLEPSCILTLKDDYLSLLGSDSKEAEAIARASITFDEFVAKHLVDGLLPISLKAIDKSIKLHGHCHQKSLVGMKPTLNVLRAIPGSIVSEIDSGCCGMAGSFGYEREHFEISMNIGELHLFPAIRENPNAMLVANGISCRSQINQGTNREARHLAEVLADLLTS
jgi:Fe-S oxidoreductase